MAEINSLINLLVCPEHRIKQKSAIPVPMLSVTNCCLVLNSKCILGTLKIWSINLTLQTMHVPSYHAWLNLNLSYTIANYINIYVQGRNDEVKKTKQNKTKQKKNKTYHGD